MMTVNDAAEAPLGNVAQNWLVAHTQDGPGAPFGNTAEGAQWREKEEVKGGDISFRDGAKAENAEIEIKRILRTHKVVLFMKGTRDAPRCGFSNAALMTLKSRVRADDIACVDCLNEVKNPGLRAEIKRFSEWPTIPQLYIGGDFVGGSEIVQKLDEAGELTALLESNGVRVKEAQSRMAAYARGRCKSRNVHESE
jgi:monothiol glutaredoxin